MSAIVTRTRRSMNSSYFKISCELLFVFGFIFDIASKLVGFELAVMVVLVVLEGSLALGKVDMLRELVERLFDKRRYISFGCIFSLHCGQATRTRDSVI